MKNPKPILSNDEIAKIAYKQVLREYLHSEHGYSLETVEFRSDVDRALRIAKSDTVLAGKLFVERRIWPLENYFSE